MSAELITQILRTQNDHAGALGALRQGHEDTAARLDKLEVLIADMRRDITREIGELRGSMLHAFGEADRRNSDLLKAAIAARPPAPAVPIAQRVREIATNPWTAYTVAGLLLVALLAALGHHDAAGAVAKAVVP